MRKGSAAALALALAVLLAGPVAARQLAPPSDAAAAREPIDLPAADLLPVQAPTAAVTCTDKIGPGIAAPAAVRSGIPGFHAAFYGQSGYPTLCPGSTSTATIAFYNSGSLGWYKAAAPARLGTWGPDPGQDKASPLGGPSTGWTAENRVATQPDDYVGPGQVAWFQFTIKAPNVPGVYRLALRPLVEGQQWLEDFGVFWYVTVKLDDETVPAIPVQTPAPATAARTYLPTTVNGVRQIRVSSLMFHYVDWLPPDPDALRLDLTVSPSDFESYLKYLKGNGYTTVTTQDIWWTLDQGGALPAKPVNLTFDDGTVGQYSYAYKLLKAYGMVGTFYVTVNLVGRPGYVTREMVKEMADNGMDIQSHAVDHVSMNTSETAQRYQMCTSRQILMQWTGKDIRHFAYPAGDYNAISGSVAAQCGYLTAWWKGGGSLQSSDRMTLLYRARVRGQQGLPALVTALAQ